MNAFCTSREILTFATMLWMVLVLFIDEVIEERKERGQVISSIHKAELDFYWIVWRLNLQKKKHRHWQIWLYNSYDFESKVRYILLSNVCFTLNNFYSRYISVYIFYLTCKQKTTMQYSKLKNMQNYKPINSHITTTQRKKGSIHNFLWNICKQRRTLFLDSIQVIVLSMEN